MKFKAPEGCTGVSVGGEQFNVKDGHIEVPDAGSYASLLPPEFVAVPEVKKKTKAELEAEAKAAAGEKA